jgi:DNA ligase-1
MIKILTLLLLSNFYLFALQIQKPKVYDDQNISGWYMSEKLDGIRAYWDGKQFLTKNGNRLHPPKKFIINFPPFALDGELWSKRDDFEFIQQTVLDSVPSNDWKKITYNIFEVPDSKGDFLNRLDKAKKWFEKHPNKYVNIIKQIKCKNENHLNTYLEEVIALKGEGVIIKDASLKYHTGRSPHILKVKKAQDMEGVVIGYNLKEDKTLKSLQIQLSNGIIFNLGSGFSKIQRIAPPKIGSTVTFKYYGYTKKGKPKFASFLRIRHKE